MQPHTDVVHAQKVTYDLKFIGGVETVLHAMDRRKLMTQVADMQSYSGLEAETLKATQKYCGEKVMMEQEWMKSQRLQTAASTA